MGVSNLKAKATCYIRDSRRILFPLVSLITGLFLFSAAVGAQPRQEIHATSNQFDGIYRVNPRRWFLISFSRDEVSYVDTSDDTEDDLKRRANDEFQTGDGLSVLRFLHDASGNINALTFTKAGTGPVTAVKVSLTEREIQATVDNGTIRGTLLMPESSQRLPVLIIVGGSGWRYGKEMMVFARLLATRGYASVVYDRLGWGKSAGKRAAGFKEWADSVAALAAMLQVEKRVDPRKIGVWGFSQAGWVVTLAASQSPAISYIALFAPALTFPFRQEEDMTIRTLKANGQSPQEIDEALELVHAKLEYALFRQDWEKYAALRKRLAARPWFRLLNAPEQPDDPDFQLLGRDAHYNSLSALSSVRVPVLAIAGEFDTAAPPDENFPLLEQGLALGGNQNLQMHVIPNANHPCFTSNQQSPSTSLSPSDMLRELGKIFLHGWETLRQRIDWNRWRTDPVMLRKFVNVPLRVR